MNKLLQVLLVSILIFTPNFVLADDYRDGIKAFDKKNYKKALEIFEPLAKEGDAVAQYNLGIMYSNGLGVGGNLKQGFKWLLRASYQGNEGAQSALNYLHPTLGDVSGNFINGLANTKDKDVYQDCEKALGPHHQNSSDIKCKEVNISGLEIIEFKYRVNGKKNGRGLFWTRFDRGIEHTFQIKNKESLETIERGFVGLEKLVLVDFDGSGNDKIFWSGNSWGSAGGSHYLCLLDPLTKEKLEMSLSFISSGGKPIPKIERSDNFLKLGLDKEINFLENIKYNFGIDGEPWVDEVIVKGSPENPEYGAYFWLEDNKKLDLGDGLIKIRRYPTNPLGGSLVKKLEAGKITYQSHFKSGVVAHNTLTDDYYILWFPTNHYDWAFDIKLVENKKTKIMYLLLNGGLIVINTKTLYLKQFYTKSIDYIPPLDF